MMKQLVIVIIIIEPQVIETILLFNIEVLNDSLIFKWSIQTNINYLLLSY